MNSQLHPQGAFEIFKSMISRAERPIVSHGRCRRTVTKESASAAILAVFFAVNAFAANSFSPGSADYKILGSLPGDQVNASVALGTNGGYIVWQDNVIDGAGQGIGAQRVDVSLQKFGPVLRVNQTAAGEQENPKAVMLDGGGAAFVWQGGTTGYPDIYARFINATSTNFLTADIRVNTYTNDAQENPSAAKLTNGNVIVVWSSQGQGGSFRGIFGQILSSNGVPIGGEIPISASPSYNHRSPAVASLPDGRFVVAWVTELKRVYNSSVDIVAQLFLENGAADGPALLVNSPSSVICANPSVAAMAGGGFTAAWSQKGAQVFNNSVASGGFVNADLWDVYGASFAPSGQSVGAPFRLNSMVVGDQYAPTLCGFGVGVLAAWSSFAQDGSWEGVYGQFLDTAGRPTGVEFPINSVQVSRQIAPTIASDGLSRFLVCWSSFGVGLNGFDLWARYYDLIRVDISPVAGGVQLSWNSYPSASYQIQQSTDQVTWSANQSVPSVSSFRTAVVLPSTGQPTFYRVVRIN